MRRLRRIKILATLGPASSDSAMIRKLFEAGADVFRINMSHTSHDKMRELRADHPQCRERATAGRSASWSICRARNCGSARSPRARSSSTTARALRSIPTRRRATTSRVHLPHPEILAALRPGHALLLDDGKVRLIAEETCPTARSRAW